MDDLLGLESCRKVPPVRVPTMLTVNPSPLQWRDWGECLADHPDSRFTAYITNGTREGFRIGYDYQLHRCKRVKGNMCSAADHPDMVWEYITKEGAEGCILGPFDPSMLPEVQRSRFGVIPKRSSSGWRLIHWRAGVSMMGSTRTYIRYPMSPGGGASGNLMTAEHAQNIYIGNLRGSQWLAIKCKRAKSLPPKVPF